MARMGRRQKDGATLHDHLIAAWKASGEKPSELDIDDLPTCAESLMHVFMQLAQTRPAGMGPSPISHRDLVAWQEINCIRLTPWESDIVLAMDSAFLKTQSE